jgi:hypothetical protein
LEKQTARIVSKKDLKWNLLLPHWWSQSGRDSESPINSFLTPITRPVEKQAFASFTGRTLPIG